MKKQWFEPKIAEISVKATETTYYSKTGVGRDSYQPTESHDLVPCECS